MLRWLDRGLTVLCIVGAAVVVVALVAGPSLIGAKTTKSSYTITSGSSGSSGSSSSKPTGAPSGAAAGAAVFSSAGCPTCHTLKAANASGTVGPNLDQLKPSADTVRSVVSSGSAGMPSFSGQLSSAQIAAVASYVSSVAGH
jgi:mono/diheme cytochrome c family protein